jgi:hypothetical protein
MGNSMSRLLKTLAVVGALALATPLSPTMANPIFGNAKVQTLDVKQMKSVVGQNTTSAYYAYLGNYYASTAVQYGSYGAYLELFGSTYQSARNTYYYSAYYYSYYATQNYYNAYYYN